MSSLPYPQQPRPQGIDWATRLIPGVAAAVRAGARKRARPVQSIVGGYADCVAKSSFAPVKDPPAGAALGLFLPGRLNHRWAASWLRSVAADFALVGLNWMLIGTVSLALQTALPQVGLFEQRAGTSFPLLLLGITLLNAALITLWGYSEGLYASTSGLDEQARSLAKAVVGSTALLCVAYGLQGAPLVSAIVLCGAGGLHFSSLLVWRWEDARRGIRPQAQDARNVLIVGAGEVGQRVAAHVESHPEAGRVVCGFLDDHRPLGDSVIGRVSNLAHLARTGFVDEVILAIPHDRDRTLWVLQEARRLRLDVEMVLDLFGCTLAAGEVEQVGGLPVICLHSERLPAGALRVKRWLDVVAASLAMVALSPLLAVIAILIRVDSNGAAIYSALRAGRKGRPFHCYKFRTMVDDADTLKDGLRSDNQRSGPFFKITNDPRVTRIGRFLRRYSLDELPQFWNVVKGDMSLVGPRPHPLDDFAAYDVEHLARLDVTPGITGLWQVTARRDPSFQKGIELDREYIRSWSLGMDMRILFRTAHAVLRGSGD